MNNKITACSIQFRSAAGDYTNNQSRAEALIRKAASKGATLILLPELALTGYAYDSSVWDYSEPLIGPTTNWMAKLSNELQVHIGTCIIEKDGCDFFDTFTLTGPDKALYSHRKIEAAAFENFYLKSAGINNAVFDTAIGRIGVGICFDLNKRYVMEDLVKSKPQILLATFCFPKLASWMGTTNQKNNWEESFRTLPFLYSKILKCPVISVNQTGEMVGSLPGLRFFENRVGFVDDSYIVDEKGNTLDSIHGEEGIAIASIKLPAIDRSINTDPINTMGHWVLPYSLSSKIMTNSSAFIGKLSYSINTKKRIEHESKFNTLVNI